MYETLALLKRKINSGKQKKKKIISAKEIYAVHGSFIILTKNFFARGGNLNYESFLYCEELFLCEQAHHLKLKVIYDSCLEILHNEHATTSIIKEKTALNYMRQSINFILNKFYN